MILFPAIDILNGRAVRLLYGKKDMVTDYGNPIERAILWQEKGAKWLHVVDLDGAFEGKRLADNALKEIVKETGLKVQSGGGLRTLDDVKRRLDTGVTRVICGTMLTNNYGEFEKALSLFGDKIVAGIDAKGGLVSVAGWTETSNITDLDLAKKVKASGCKTTVYTDISKDGALTGVNVESTYKMQENSGLNVIASGGVSTVSDLYKLKEKNIYGAILGKSIYSGSIDLEFAIKEIEKC